MILGLGSRVHGHGDTLKLEGVEMMILDGIYLTKGGDGMIFFIYRMFISGDNWCFSPTFLVKTKDGEMTTLLDLENWDSDSICLFLHAFFWIESGYM